jgi:ABC-type branched-subunit amino acid transport system substrate-binding protein
LIFRTAILFIALATGAQARELVVGQLVDYGGKYGEVSRDYVAGAKVHFDSLNARGGVNGMRIRHVVLDAARGARLTELIDDKAVDVLFGFVGDEALAAAAAEPAIRDGAVALVAPLAGIEAPAARGVFFIRPGYASEIRQVESHFRALQLTRFAVLEERQLGDVNAVLALNAQALIVNADTVPLGEFIKKFRPRDPGAMIVGLSTVNHRAMFELLGPKLAHGVMITQVVPNPSVAESPILKEHLDAIRTFRDEPPSHLTLEGFIAARTLVEAVRRAGADPSRAAIVASLQRMGRLDLKGFVVNLTPAGRAESFVDIAMIRRNGGLLQ